MTAEPDGPVTLATRHVIVPAAIIAMVTAFLFYFLEIRALFWEGTGAFRVVGFCFAVATVLIARYGRVSADAQQQGCYTLFLAGATFFFMLQRSSIAAFLPNLLIVAAVWRFATGVTGALSLETDLDLPPRDLHIYGVERLRYEDFRQRQQEEKGPAWGMLSRLGRRAKPEAQGNPVAAVARLAALALLGFALGEPLLLKATPDVGVRALADVIVFLFATAVVLAAGSSVGALRRTRAAGGRVSPTILPTRIGVAALLAVAVLATALAIPGIHFQGQGQLRTVDSGVRGTGDNQSDPERPGERPPPSGKEPSPEGLSGAAEPVPGETPEEASRGTPRDPRPEARPATRADLGPAAALIDALSGLGKLLRIALLAALPILAFLAVLYLPALKLSRWGGLLARFRAWLRQLFPERKRKPRPPPLVDPFAGMGALSALPPRAAILGAYGHLLIALDQAGHPRAERTTPYEHLRALPHRLKPVAEPTQTLTDLYVSAAYGAGEPTERDREQALVSLATLAAFRELLRAPFV